MSYLLILQPALQDAFDQLAEELRGIMAQLGFRTLAEMVGQTHKINANHAIKHYKAKGLDLSSILHRPAAYRELTVKNTEKQDHNLENVLDFDILKDSQTRVEEQRAEDMQQQRQMQEQQLQRSLNCRLEFVDKLMMQ